MNKNYCFLLILLIPFFSLSQEIKQKKRNSNKGTIYAFWGWNREWYTNSDIQFQGDNYDFKLENVKATDRQSEFNFDTYLNIKNISIPQTNLRIGYFINDNIDISIGVDHMKYVMVQDQTSKITGTINNETTFDGTYNAKDINLTQNFLVYEHTDGLNYLNTEITYNNDILKILKIKSNTNKISLNYLIGFGTGVMMPKSNIKLMNNKRNDTFHFGGYGLAGKTGVHLTLFKHLFFRSELKGGYAHLLDIKTTALDSDKARQHFFFTEFTYVVGFSFNPFNSKKSNEN